MALTLGFRARYSWIVTRRFNTIAVAAATPPAGFTYISPFLNKQEQLVLTKAALDHLDNVGSAAARRKIKRLLISGKVSQDELGFLPEDECYQFEEGHFDGVIRNYREARITDDEWSALGDAQLGSILAKLRSLLPPVPLQFHALHLSSKGEILPHIDNKDASGSIIMGVSLGSPRILRLEGENGGIWDQLLEPGSCYIQHGSIRYHYRHSILKAGLSDGFPAQRLSIMVRDMPGAAHEPAGVAGQSL